MNEQYYYTQLYDAVSQRQYKDVPFKLRRLGNEHVSFVKSNDMTDFFNKHKDGCMRGILYILKNHDDYGLTGKDFVAIVKGARKIGINWPELDVIEKTGNSMQPDISLWDDETEVDEADNMSNDQAEANMHYEGLIDDLREDIYDDIRYWFQFIGRKGRPDHLMPVGFFDSHKTGILKRILSAMKYADEYDYSNSDIQEIVQGARNIGLTWPELDAIEKSIVNKVDETMRVDLKDPRERMLDRLEFIFNDPDTDVFDRIAELDIARNVLRRIDKSDVEEILEKYKTNIIKDTLHYLRHGVVDVEIPVYIRTLKDLGADWPELKIILRSITKDKNTHELDENDELANASEAEQIATVQKEPVAIHRIPNPSEAVQLAAVKQFGIVIRFIHNPSEAVQLAAVTALGLALKHIKNPSKTVIITAILSLIKNQYIDSASNPIITKYKKQYPEWPEWAIITKSLNAKNINETTDMTNHGVSMIIDGLEERNFDLIPYALAIIGAQGHRPTYGFVPEFNKNKTEIIRAMLYAIKNPDDYDLWFPHAPSYMIKGARMLGLNWDELDKIERSVGPVDELNEATDSSTRYNMNGLIASIEADEPRETVLFLSQLSWANNLPDMSDELAPYIQSIVKAMLEFLKYEESDSEPVDTVRDCLTALKKMNIHSKEIDIIDRSLSIGQQT